jgi:hypothetical protein
MLKDHIAIFLLLYSMMELRIQIGETLIPLIGITRILQSGKVTIFYTIDKVVSCGGSF